MAPYLRDTDRLMYPAVCETIAVLKLDPAGQASAAAKLAKLYAIAIDEASDAKQASVLRWLGPELLKVLESLGATPAARAAIKKPTKPADDKPNGLAKLRAARGA